MTTRECLYDMERRAQRALPGLTLNHYQPGDTRYTWRVSHTIPGTTAQRDLSTRWMTAQECEMWLEGFLAGASHEDLMRQSLRMADRLATN